MGSVATTKLSSKGQVVIPEEIRKQLHLKSGDRFMVLGRGDTVILKAIEQPSLDIFEALLQEANVSAKKAGLTRSSIKTAIRQARHKKK